MNKLFFLIFFPFFIKSQIGVSFFTELDRKSVVVTITNHSSKNYVLPLEMTNLKPYWEGENSCETLSYYHSQSHQLSFSLKLTDSKTNIALEPQDTHVNLDFDFIEKELKKNNDCYNINSELKKWQQKFKIKDQKAAELNYYIYNNLIFLKPNQKIKFRLLTDLQNISNELYFVYRYDTKPDKRYRFELLIEINNCAYDILTPEQKEEMKDYSFFTGKLQSNKLNCDFLQ
ncbi:hypothetical protein OMO38_03925 [Chryseobacterium sp. 09-1422]|uniref:Uncharacterized protein n=1 Tax=Chryseobacterium kimseyorum TaxID=2984028 RepID=A0ABT3HV74_9FLAO|nr:hypothetical protein [Chryseobacterium kimseyorum]MCW3167669.1 hypothetical protein [Chryseobacterium kimseyorum]